MNKQVQTYSAGQQQTSAVGCCVVRQAHGDAVFRQLVRVGRAHDHITLNLGIGNLQHNHKKRMSSRASSVAGYEYDQNIQLDYIFI